MTYKVDNYYSPEHDGGLAFDDEQLNIDWRLATSELILSDKDSKQPRLSSKSEGFDFNLDGYE